jgi:hypothetical protein
MGVDWESILTFGFVTQGTGVESANRGPKAVRASKSGGHTHADSSLTRCHVVAVAEELHF